MKKSRQKQSLGWVLTIVLSMMSYFFRSTQLSGGSAVLPIAFSVLAAIGFALSAVALQPAQKFREVFRRDMMDAVLSIAGALLIGAASFPELMGVTLGEKIVGAAGILAAAGLILSAVQRQSKVQPRAFGYVLAVLFCAVKLFVSFRGWITTADIDAYCFRLLALLSTMLATYYAGEFCFDKGHRRRMCFAAMLGAFFGMAAIAGQPVEEMLCYGGSALWMLALTRRALAA